MDNLVSHQFTIVGQSLISLRDSLQLFESTCVFNVSVMTTIAVQFIYYAALNVRFCSGCQWSVSRTVRR